MQKSDCRWLALVVLAAIAFSIWGLPYFSQLGHPILSVLVYGFLLVIFLYGRANRYGHKSSAAKKVSKPV